MNLIKKLGRAEWFMFVITVALLFCIHGYCTVGANTYEELVVDNEVVGPQTPVEVVVDEVVEETSEEVEKPLAGAVEPENGIVEVEKDAVEFVEEATDEVELGEFIFHTATEYGVKPEIVMAIIEKESGWNASAAGDSGRSLGLMQIQPRWHQWRMDEIFGPGNGDWLNPYHNVAVGCHLLRDLYATGLSEEWVLMAYNGGYGYAHKKVAEGVVSDYARFVMVRAAELREL